MGKACRSDTSMYRCTGEPLINWPYKNLKESGILLTCILGKRMSDK
jgi:hypothetical protein